MLKHRLQILVDPDQRRQLEAEARRRGISVGAVVREAIDARLGGTSREDKQRAIAEMRAVRPRDRALEPEELNRLLDEVRDADTGDRIARVRDA